MLRWWLAAARMMSALALVLAIAGCAASNTADTGDGSSSRRASSTAASNARSARSAPVGGGPASAATPSSHLTGVVLTPAPGAPVITAADAVAVALADSSHRGGHHPLIGARLLQYGDLIGVIPGETEVPQGFTASQPVWVVSFKGPIAIDSVAPSRPLDWGSTVIDASTGRDVEQFGGFGELPVALEPPT